MKWFGHKRIYLDYASAPPVLSEAVTAMREAEKLVGNAGAIHAEGVAAKKSLEDSRTRIAALIGCKAREIVFTSGLTEANNLAILGFARHLEILRSDLSAGGGSALGGKGSQGRTLEGTHWIVSSIEHDSVLRCFAEIERMGGMVSHVEPDQRGIISPEAIERALRPETVFVSIGWANNEIGTIQPLAKIARVLRTFGEQRKKMHPSTGSTSSTGSEQASSPQASSGRVAFHTDAGQAPLYLRTLINSLGLDLLSLGANKLYGPHGIGALYVSNDVELAPVTFGGKQERGLRAGTESIALAAGFATAFEIVAEERKSEMERLRNLRGVLARELLARISGLVVNSDLKHILPHMLNVSIPKSSGWRTSEYVTLALDHAGIAVSTKSACREGEESQSHVVAALGGDAWKAGNTIRFSLGRNTSASDIQKAASTLAYIISAHQE